MRSASDRRKVIKRSVKQNFSFPGIFVEHPVKPAPIVDPLALPDRVARDGSRWPTKPRIGYGAFWEPVLENTSSGSVLRLRDAMRETADVVDIGVQIPTVTRTALRAVHLKYRCGRLTSTWGNSRLTDAHLARALRNSIAKNSRVRDLDAVLTIDSLAVLPEPFFIYAYSSWDQLAYSADPPQLFAAQRMVSPATMSRRRDRQVAVYEHATGIIAETKWLARCLTELSGIPAEKVQVVHPAIPAGPSLSIRRKTRIREAPRRKLLFITGQSEPEHFYRKGGDLILKALVILRRDYDPEITVTMAGMSRWPIPGAEPPAGINFAGALPSAEVEQLYDSHDLFVMPSRLETFGIVLVEALSRGLPCVARNACAMPEIVTPGK